MIPATQTIFDAIAQGDLAGTPADFKALAAKEGRSLPPNPGPQEVKFVVLLDLGQSNN